MVTAQMSRKLFALVLLSALASTARADVIMDWNARADAIATDKRLLPPMQGRVLAIMHVAMFEAVNAIERRYVPYRLKLVADRKTSGETAAAVRGSRCARGVVSRSEVRRSTRCSRKPEPRSQEGPAKERGIILGRKAAADILELRAADGSEVPETTDPSRSPVCTCRRQCRSRRR